MGIGVEGEPCGKVAEHAADGLDIYAVLQGDGGAERSGTDNGECAEYVIQNNNKIEKP